MVPKKFEEWLEWGKDASGSGIKVQRGLRIRIGGDQGTYYGEWKVDGSKKTVCGRAALDCKDKWIFGFDENGEWADKSPQIVVQKNRDEFQVLKVQRSKSDGTYFAVGRKFNSDGLAESGLFREGKLLKSFDVPNQESGFMGIGGKFT